MLSVAPHVGAWIETLSSSLKGLPDTGRSPREGVD